MAKIETVHMVNPSMEDTGYTSELFEVFEPDRHRIPFVFNSPHSGRRYTPDFLAKSRLDAQAIRRSEDHYVDQLFAGARTLGAPMMVAHFPRAYLDVNREPYELDPRMFDGLLPPYTNLNSVRVAGGLGTIPRIVAENMEIYRSRLSVDDAMDRIEGIYKPYHACLRKLIARTHVRFGYAVLIDCHSMPGNIRLAGNGMKPDFIIGDRYGTSASAEVSRIAVKVLQDLGFNVVRNKPYAGGFITEHYGRPARGLHALQIEVNRGLYIDEAKLVKKSNFDALTAQITEFLSILSNTIIAQSGPSALAAE